VGAGIIGGSIAWRLAQARIRVLLIDAARMGEEASSAGAGMLAPGGEMEEHSAGNDLGLESLRLYPAYVAELEEETGCAIDFQRLGAVELAFTGPEWEALQARAARQSLLGIAAGSLDPRDLRQHVPMARQEVAGALFYPQDALVDPRDVLSALRVACTARNVEIREGVRVAAIRADGPTVHVESPGETWEAAAAILAAGAWSSEIAVEGQALPQAFPVRGHLIGYPMETHSLGPLLRHGSTYLLQRNGGLLIAGTSSERVGFDRNLDPAIVQDIRRRAAQIAPPLAALEPSEQWVGFRPAVEGVSPVLGRLGGSPLWLAYGHYRNGILMAPGTAQRIAADLIASSGTGWSAPPGRL
jgi:glycine oxidase